MSPDGALTYLRDRAGQWVPITTKETLASLRVLRERGEPVRIRFMSGVREATFDAPAVSLAEIAARVLEATPIEEVEQRCPHPRAQRIVRENGTICRECGEVIARPEFRPKVYGPDDPPPWNKHLAPEQEDAGLVRSTATCPSCGEEYLDPNDHLATSERHAQMKAGVSPLEIPVPDQEPTAAYPEDMDISRIGFGDAVICPRCHGKKQGAREQVISRKVGRRTERHVVKVDADTFTHEPGSHGTRCRRCNGHGLVPLAGGPVPQSQEVMDVDGEQRRAAAAARRARYAPSAGQVGLDDGPDDPAPRVPPRGKGRPKPRKPPRPLPDPLARPAEPQGGLGGGETLPDPPGPG